MSPNGRLTPWLTVPHFRTEIQDLVTSTKNWNDVSTNKDAEDFIMMEE